MSSNKIRAQYLCSGEVRVQESFHSSDTIRGFGIRFRGYQLLSVIIVDIITFVLLFE